MHGLAGELLDRVERQRRLVRDQYVVAFEVGRAGAYRWLVDLGQPGGAEVRLVVAQLPDDVGVARRNDDARLEAQFLGQSPRQFVVEAAGAVGRIVGASARRSASQDDELGAASEGRRKVVTATRKKNGEN